MKRKYAIVAINKKEDDNGLHLRSVLISYLFKTHKEGLTYYHGTKLIAIDKYFTDPSASHKYTFKNSYYKLDEANNENAFLYSFKTDIYKKRKYHSQDKYKQEFYSLDKQQMIDLFFKGENK